MRPNSRTSTHFTTLYSLRSPCVIWSLLRSFARRTILTPFGRRFAPHRRSLDPALIRPGRIDRKIEFPLPDVPTKRHIFGIHTSKMTLGTDVDLEKFIMSKDDLSGADIKAVCTEAGMLALRERRMKVTQVDFEKAKEKALYRKKGNQPEGLYL